MPCLALLPHIRGSHVVCVGFLQVLAPSHSPKTCKHVWVCERGSVNSCLSLSVYLANTMTFCPSMNWFQQCSWFISPNASRPKCISALLPLWEPPKTSQVSWGHGCSVSPESKLKMEKQLWVTEDICFLPAFKGVVLKDSSCILHFTVAFSCWNCLIILVAHRYLFIIMIIMSIS